MAEILRVEDLKKYFATKKGTLHAVDGVTFTVDAGKTLGIVGESGCGKSTLGRVILHLHERTEGRIVFQGEDISDVSNAKLKELRKDMQIIFQDPYASLNPRMSIGDIIAEPLKIYKLCNSKTEREKKVHEIMDVVGLAERTYSLYPHELDGGRRQRVGIARALILDPKLGGQRQRFRRLPVGQGISQRQKCDKRCRNSSVIFTAGREQWKRLRTVPLGKADPHGRGRSQGHGRRLRMVRGGKR